MIIIKFPIFMRYYKDFDKWNASHLGGDCYSPDNFRRTLRIWAEEYFNHYCSIARSTDFGFEDGLGCWVIFEFEDPDEAMLFKLRWA